ncbi:hypothetical protein [Streptomyces sp. AC495_CC817]|uniref:hypothetical protein n=1 Tax=Streptomyces sp. AC495_CC817 TaxID=2823900 RepID=UPI001C264CB6|nr:hypothetical protein [Streptomyces sp. AC495_CC817]
MNARLLAWAAAWVVPLLSTVVGIVLTTTPTLSTWGTDGTTSFLESTLDVWPAGLVLLGAGVLGLSAVALASAVSGDRAEGVRPPFTDRTPPRTTTADARTETQTGSGGRSFRASR